MSQIFQIATSILIHQDQNSNATANMSQQQGQAALASLLKANNLVSGQPSTMLSSIYSPSQLQQMLKSGNMSPATLAALVESSAKVNGNQQQRSLITNSSNGIQPGRNGLIGENVDEQVNSRVIPTGLELS